MIRTWYVPLIAALALSAPGAALAQSTSPFAGPYAGVSASHGFDGRFDNTNPGIIDFDFDAKGEQVGALAGWGFAFDRVVARVEVDFNAGSFESQLRVVDPPFTFDTRIALENNAALKLQAGFTPTSNLLLFGSAGVVRANLSGATLLSSPLLGPLSPFDATSVDTHETGSVYGGGGEFALASGLRLRLEYARMRFEDVAYESRSPFAPPTIVEAEATSSLVRAAAIVSF